MTVIITPIILVAGFPSFGDIFHHPVLIHFYSFLVFDYKKKKKKDQILEAFT